MPPAKVSRASRQDAIRVTSDRSLPAQDRSIIDYNENCTAENHDGCDAPTQATTDSDAGKTELIRAWQQAADAHAEIQDLGIVGGLFDGCIRLFKALARRISKNHQLHLYQERVRQSLETLYLWGDGFGLDRGDLDRALAQSQSVRNMVLAALISIAEVLSQALIRHAVIEKEERDVLLSQSNILSLIERARYVANEPEETEIAPDAIDTLEEILEDLQAYMECLRSLAPSIECPAKETQTGEDERVRASPTLKAKGFHEFYTDMISSRFPRASRTLADCLGKRNWRRYKRLQAIRAANALKEIPATEELEFLAQKSAFGESNFHDSGLGTSVPARTSHAQSMASFASSRAESSHAKLPPLSEEAKSGRPFPCDACGSTIRIKRKRDWRKHIFDDLLPYMCLFETCPYYGTTFSDLDTWINHLALGHGFAPEWSAQCCPLCYEITSCGRHAVTTHFAKHLEEIALAVLPRDSDSEVNSEDGSMQSRTPLPKFYQEIQQAALNLHKSLKNTWYCTNVLHADHHAKLLLDAKVKDGVGVHLDIAISSKVRSPSIPDELHISNEPAQGEVNKCTGAEATLPTCDRTATRDSIVDHNESRSLSSMELASEPIPLPRRLCKMYLHTKESCDIVTGPPRTEALLEMTSLYRKFRIQRDRLVSWGRMRSDANALQLGWIVQSVVREGSVLSSIKEILDEAERIGCSDVSATKQETVESAKTYDAKVADDRWSVWDKPRLEDLLQDLTTSIDTLYALSKSRSGQKPGKPNAV